MPESWPLIYVESWPLIYVEVMESWPPIYVSICVVFKIGKSYLLSCRAFNGAAAGLMTVGSRVAQNSTIIKLDTSTLNAL